MSPVNNSRRFNSRRQMPSPSSSTLVSIHVAALAGLPHCNGHVGVKKSHWKLLLLILSFLSLAVASVRPLFWVFASPYVFLPSFFALVRFRRDGSSLEVELGNMFSKLFTGQCEEDRSILHPLLIVCAFQLHVHFCNHIHLNYLLLQYL